MIKYKIDILAELKNRGYTTYKLMHEKLIYSKTIEYIRRGDIVSGKGLDTICRLLECQPGDIIEYVPDDENQD